MEKEVSFLVQQTLRRARLSGLLSIAGMGLSILQAVIGLIYDSKMVATTLLSLVISLGIGMLMVFHILGFSKKMNLGIEMDDKDLMHEAVLHLKNYFKVIGVLFIILMGMIVLGIIISVLALVFSKH